MSSPICVWDFTLGEEYAERLHLVKSLNKHCKKWAFQLEEGKEQAFQHYQGRFSLKIKTRLGSLKKLFNIPQMHYSITSNANKKNNFYVLKEDTKIAGPWTSEDEVLYVPRQIREIQNLYPWQEKVIKLSKLWDTRSIHWVFDKDGNHGKTVLKGWMRAYKLGRALPFCNNYKDLLRMVCDMPTSSCYLIDLPRAINKDALYQMYAGIESIKDGYAFDDRYKFREKYFDCPSVFVFSNTLPDQSLLTKDRWKIYEIVNKELHDFSAKSKTSVTLKKS